MTANLGSVFQHEMLGGETWSVLFSKTPLYCLLHIWGSKKETKQPQLHPYNKKKAFYIYKIFPDALEADERGREFSSCGAWEVDLTRLSDSYKILSCIFRIFPLLSGKKLFFFLNSDSAFTKYFYFIPFFIERVCHYENDLFMNSRNWQGSCFISF